MLIDPQDLYIYRSYDHACPLISSDVTSEDSYFGESVGHIFPSNKNRTQKGVKIPTKIQQRDGTSIFVFPTSTTKYRRKEMFTHWNFLAFHEARWFCCSFCSLLSFLSFQTNICKGADSSTFGFGVSWDQDWRKWIEWHITRPGKKATTRCQQTPRNLPPTPPKNILEMSKMDRLDPKFSNGFSKTVAIWKPLPSESQDNHCKFSESVFFAYFCCCFEWYLTARLDKNFVCTNFIHFIKKHVTNREPPGWCLTKESGPGPRIRPKSVLKAKKWGVNFSRLNFRGFFRGIFGK